MIEPAADYSFNKSHAACYAYISYQTAWLKAHYGLAFHAALLRSVEEDTDKLAKFVDEIKLQGYDIRLPDVNSSFEHVAAVDDHIIL
jgi:DNA polymerase-3 subunit alpha